MESTLRVKRYLSILLIGLSPNVFAVDDFEREELSRLLNEFDYLDNIIVVARNSSSENDGVHFDYQSLDRDLQRIKAGISEYLSGTKREPRKIKELSGDYSFAR